MMPNIIPGECAYLFVEYPFSLNVDPGEKSVGAFHQQKGYNPDD